MGVPERLRDLTRDHAGKVVTGEHRDDDDKQKEADRNTNQSTHAHAESDLSLLRTTLP